MYKISLNWTEGTMSQHNVQIRLKVTVNHVLLMLKFNNYGLTISVEASLVVFCGTYTNDLFFIDGTFHGVERYKCRTGKNRSRPTESAIKHIK